MDFFGFFEDEQDQGTAQEEVSQPVPTQPFPFLKLPREIRDSVYSYALMRPGTGPCAKPAICEIEHKASRYVSRSHWGRPYWGTEKSTRLFRVNHQVYSEASEIFYSTFPFHFPLTIDVALINDSLRATLNLRARTLIRKVGFFVSVRSIPGPYTAEDDAKQRLAFEAVVKLLPNIRQVEISLAVGGHDAPDGQVMQVVYRVLKTLGPLKDLPGLTVRGSFNENNQRTRIMEGVREALGCK